RGGYLSLHIPAPNAGASILITISGPNPCSAPQRRALPSLLAQHAAKNGKLNKRLITTLGFAPYVGHGHRPKGGRGITRGTYDVEQACLAWLFRAGGVWRAQHRPCASAIGRRDRGDGHARPGALPARHRIACGRAECG